MNSELLNRFTRKLVLYGSATFAIAILFKIMHWPYTGLLLVLGTTTITIGFIFKGMLAKEFMGKLFAFVFALVIFSYLFKVMQWPSGDLLATVGFFGSAVLVIASQLPAHREWLAKNKFTVLGFVLIVVSALTGTIPQLSILGIIGIWVVLGAFAFNKSAN